MTVLAIGLYSVDLEVWSKLAERPLIKRTNSKCTQFWLRLGGCKYVFPLRYSETRSTSANYLLLRWKSAGSCCYGIQACKCALCVRDDMFTSYFKVNRVGVCGCGCRGGCVCVCDNTCRAFSSKFCLVPLQFQLSIKSRKYRHFPVQSGQNLSFWGSCPPVPPPSNFDAGAITVKSATTSRKEGFSQLVCRIIQNPQTFYHQIVEIECRMYIGL